MNNSPTRGGGGGMGGGRRLVIGVVSVIVVILAGVGIAGRSLGWFGDQADPAASAGGGGVGDGQPGCVSQRRQVVGPRADVPEATLPASTVRVLASGLCAPWGLAFLPDGTALVTERDTARILSVTSDGRVTEVQRVSQARPRGEGGLLGIAVSPDYASDRWVYIYYLAESDFRIARLRLGEEPEPILTGIPADQDGFHGGGRIAFGPDGMLYAGTGETYYTREIAQDPGSLGGKILRITPDGDPAPGNPIPGSPVYSMGHRHVQGLAWDAQGRLFASEFGENEVDELNLIEAGGNYGWPTEEGPSDDRRFVNPVATWAVAEASPSGIAIVGDQVYLACLRGERLYRIGLDGQNRQGLNIGDFGRLRHVARAPDGSLWVLTSNRDGRGIPQPDDDRIIRITL
jgi:glucose/arabinose dehydrogenase